ncbi:MAG: DsrE family protein [Prosthecobacter sp.]|uniref:DsrE family protein n=1 Tax=Prosthecobacter sp. TaxID=1965333 RepID=UPI0025D138F8|nr:DsrE family protein [Prosthecobacter sp.]MCF7787131.1 DsrE family protein [Prosthecobacter sp.]
MKTIQLRSIIPVIALALAWISPLFQPTLSAQTTAGEKAAVSPKGKPTVVVNITRSTDDLHAACMGISLASNAIKAGRRAVIFLNVHAAVLATADLSADLKFADFPPVKQMIASFVADGGELYVCGHCAAVSKVAESNLIKGAVVVHHEDLFKALPAAALSFSY